MASKGKNSAKTATAKAIIGKPFVKGEPSPNPTGRPKGQRNYATIYRLALEKIAENKGMTADDVEMAIVLKGVEKAIKGDYKFAENILDRIHGKPVQTNLNKSIDDVEIDEAEVGTLDAMLTKFMKKKKPTPKPKKKVASK